jgi:hypothetical protein
MIIDSPWDYSLDHDLPESSVTGDRNHLRIRARIPESPVCPRPDRRSAPGVGLRRRKRPPRHRSTAGRRPPRRLKSAFQGAARQADPLPFGTGQWPKASTPIEIGLQRRLRARRRPPPTQKTPSRSAQADHRPKASTPIEIGLPRRCAPSVGLRRRKRPPPGRHRPTIGRRPPQAEFIRHTWPKAPTPIEIGLPRRLRAKRRPPPTQDTSSVGTGHRRPKASTAEGLHAD